MADSSNINGREVEAENGNSSQKDHSAEQTNPNTNGNQVEGGDGVDAQNQPNSPSSSPSTSRADGGDRHRGRDHSAPHAHQVPPAEPMKVEVVRLEIVDTVPALEQLVQRLVGETFAGVDCEGLP